MIDTKAINAALAKIGATAAVDEVLKFPISENLLVVTTGLGKHLKSYSQENLRRAAGAAARSLMNKKSATFSLPHQDEHGFAGIAEGSLLGAYSFNEFKGKASAKDQPVALSEIVIHSKNVKGSKAKEVLNRASVIARYTFLVRDLINTPPSHLTPESFCRRFQKVAAGKGVKVEILNDSQLRKLGYGGTLAVGQGSASKPRLLQISYVPKNGAKKSTSRKSRKSSRLAFVGKGITFDSGGLALKPAANMDEMKADMTGAASVVGAILAIAELKLPVAIDAWAALAENMVSDTATRPSDVITIYGGKTVEVLNPDAEGCLVLADAIVKAQENKNLDAIIDVATLTGAKVVALGTRYSAVMTNNDDLCAEFLDVTDVTGEQFWQLPLPEELRASLDTPIADIANIGERMGGALVAGLFLKEFINDELPWLHLDIAGVELNTGKAHGHTPVGATGVSVRSLIEMAK